jgi:hypothetical protein
MSDIRIIVLQRGWVVVGYCRRDGEEIVIEKPAVIRTWGTTGGLGELADKGPTSTTKLDKCTRPIRVHVLAKLFDQECDPEKWEGRL